MVEYWNHFHFPQRHSFLAIHPIRLRFIVKLKYFLQFISFTPNKSNKMNPLLNILPEDIVQTIMYWKVQFIAAGRNENGWNAIHKELISNASFNIIFTDEDKITMTSGYIQFNAPPAFIVLRSILKPWSLPPNVPYHFITRSISVDTQNFMRIPSRSST